MLLQRCKDELLVCSACLSAGRVSVGFEPHAAMSLALSHSAEAFGLLSARLRHCQQTPSRRRRSPSLRMPCRHNPGACGGDAWRLGVLSHTCLRLLTARCTQSITKARVEIFRLRLTLLRLSRPATTRALVQYPPWAISRFVLVFILSLGITVSRTENANRNKRP